MMIATAMTLWTISSFTLEPAQQFVLLLLVLLGGDGAFVTQVGEPGERLRHADGLLVRIGRWSRGRQIGFDRRCGGRRRRRWRISRRRRGGGRLYRRPERGRRR